MLCEPTGFAAAEAKRERFRKTLGTMPRESGHHNQGDLPPAAAIRRFSACQEPYQLLHYCSSSSRANGCVDLGGKAPAV